MDPMFTKVTLYFWSQFFSWDSNTVVWHRFGKRMEEHKEGWVRVDWKNSAQTSPAPSRPLFYAELWKKQACRVDWWWTDQRQVLQIRTLSPWWGETPLLSQVPRGVLGICRSAPSVPGGTRPPSPPVASGSSSRGTGRLQTHGKTKPKQSGTGPQARLPHRRGFAFVQQLCHVWVGCLPSPTERDFCFKHFSTKTASDNTELLKTLSSLFWEKSSSASALILFKCFSPFPPSSEKLTIIIKHVLVFPLSHCQFLTFWITNYFRNATLQCALLWHLQKQIWISEDLGTCDMDDAFRYRSTSGRPVLPPPTPQCTQCAVQRNA